jgi:hypothetical protein
MLELAMSISITATVMFAAASITKTSVESSAGIGTSSGLSVRSCEAANAISKALTNSGLDGEDTNGNRLLDPAEDVNRNGRLDCDFSLANGASSGSLTFNAVDSSYRWSTPITFSVVNGVLRRTQDGSVLEICRNVSSLTFSRNGDLIDFALTLTAADVNARKWSSTAKRRVNVRN